MKRLCVISVAGTRSQLVKAAPVCRALRESHDELLVHAGQHYDYSMSDTFFEQIGIPKPDFSLAVGSGSHARQTGEMMSMLEELFIEKNPDLVVVYGDTNTTLAAGLAAAKLCVPVAHVEAGLRSYNRSMPEEINRVLVDHISELLLCPTRVQVANLATEGITSGVHLVGDVMLDTAKFFAEHVDPAHALEQYGVRVGEYYFATVHRSGNSDSKPRLQEIISAFSRLDMPVLWAIHPRLSQNIEDFGLGETLASAENLIVVPLISYIDTVSLLRSAKGILTDSGGMQKEAYFFGVPCVTMREDTEWTETVELGWNALAGADSDRIVAAVSAMSRPEAKPSVYGDGNSAVQIVEAIEARFGG